MEFVSILNNKRDTREKQGVPVFFEDLNLYQVIDQIQALSSVPVKKYYYQLPADKACEDYRRAVYADVKKADVNQLLLEFTERVEDRKQARERKSEVSLEPQRLAWHIIEVASYCEAYGKLQEELQKVTLYSEGLQAFRELLEAYVASDNFVSMQTKALKLREQLQNFRIKIVLEDEKITVIEDRVPGAYETFLRDALGEHNMQMKSPFSQSVNLSDFEQEIVQKFAKQQPGFFEEARKFYRKYETYAHEALLQFGDEISYYLSYHAFQKNMELRGYSFTAPNVNEQMDMSANGLYDLALACANLNTEKEVVSNAMCYCKGESFLVVTGPNQGGKTTFARSLGQLVYLCKMGLDVPATAANVHYFSNILTHFSVEESVETGRGKLMDELVRLKPMMSVNCKNAFVIINELFTTAANYDACIMGQKVLEHFIAQECRGIYVTHLKELSTAHESIVSMRAMLDEQNKQNFKISRQEAVDSACAINQVNKYHLTYEQVKERLR